MSCEEETAELLRRAGHKMTPQRLLILRALRHAGGHVSAARITEQVRETYPFVDISTVYRTLDVLKRMRLATVTDMGSGDAMFEWAPEQPHHHLICAACGHTEQLDHSYLDLLADHITRDFGFEPDLHHFAIFGLCSECRAGDME
ncbi:MAG: transcriptional repressor [Chloroflexi bacterium]|nr:transcriptional repressor [Chloroflexota bacterium]